MYNSFRSVVPAKSYRQGSQPYSLPAGLPEALLKRAHKPAQTARPNREMLRAKAELAASKKEAVRILKEAHTKTQAMRREARRLAAQLAVQARKEGFQQGLQAGSSEGYEKGLAQGEQDGLARWSESVARWQNLLEAICREKEQYLADRERLLVELVMQVSAKLLGRELRQHPEEIRSRVAEAIQRTNLRARLLVHLHPEDLAKLQEAGNQAGIPAGRIKQIEYVADDRIMQGGVRIESGTETIDASMDTQLTAIIRGLIQEAYHAD